MNIDVTELEDAAPVILGLTRSTGFDSSALAGSFTVPPNWARITRWVHQSDRHHDDVQRDYTCPVHEVHPDRTIVDLFGDPFVAWHADWDVELGPSE